jgi:hypothetical protein
MTNRKSHRGEDSRDPQQVTFDRVWLPWLHFNLWSFLFLIVFVSNALGWGSHIDKYKERSEIFPVDVLSNTFSVRERMFLPHVFISEFQGKVRGERKFFAIFSYPGKWHKVPTARHETIYAVINVDHFASLGGDVDHPIPILKYGVSPAMENFDYTRYDVNSGFLYDAYQKNVVNYFSYNKHYGGISIMELVDLIYLWISLPWGIGCGVYVGLRRALRLLGRS